MTPPAEGPLPRSFFARPALDVARDLLGVRLSDGVVVAELVEVEAYAGAADPGSHAYRGRTARNGTMFGPAGHFYVYFTYGMHWCMNVVCGEAGTASAVLLRAARVVDGLGEAVARRPAARPVDLARGPARLARLFGVDRSVDGVDATDAASPLRLLPGAAVPDARVGTGPRVGLSARTGEAASWPWRFFVRNEPTVSSYRPGQPRRRPRVQARSEG